MKTFVVDNSFLQSVWSCFDKTTTHLKSETAPGSPVKSQESRVLIPDKTNR